MNQVNITGRLGGDVELRYTPTSKAVARMSVAVNEKYRDKEKVYWLIVICWNGLAESVSTYLHKGSKVGVSGRITTRTFDTKDGDSRTVTEIVANSVDFLDPKPANHDQTSHDQNGDGDNTSFPGEDIPF